MTQLLSLTMKEVARYGIIQKLINKDINGSEASKQLGLSVRQVRRLKHKVKEQGIQGIRHGARGNPGNHRADQKTEAAALHHVKNLYLDFGPTLAAEKLKEIHAINFSIEKVRQLMIKENIWTPRKRKQNKEYRSWRPRKDSYGEMQQFDGSYHKWFEDRAGEECLLAAIDDATGKITKAEFADNESVVSVFSFWRSYIAQNGKPLTLYLDKYSTYKINHASAVDNGELLTQFERACEDLGIKLITANSPQAKGRIERLFDTLQDRLVKEMRLRNISDRKTANKFLREEFIPWFNKKFGVAPAKRNDLHREAGGEEQKKLDSIFSIQSHRTINNDFTLRFKNEWFQLGEIQPCLVRKGETTIVEERLDGSIYFKLKENYLNYVKLKERPKKLEVKVAALTRTKSSWKPPENHPWRKPMLFGKNAALI